jgi:hypothetical protein
MRLSLKINLHSVIFIIILSVLSTILVLKLQSFPQVQFLIVTALIFFYLTWALFYHFKDKSLSLEVMLEYILTALLALVCFYGILL